MADYSGFKPITGTLDYINKYSLFIDEMETQAGEVETAREGETNLVTNLQDNYVKYTLAADLDGSSTYKCTNMAPASANSDYATWGQAQGLSGGTVPVNITDLVPGTLTANQIVVTSTDGLSIVGRDATYTTISTSPLTVAYNKKYDLNMTSNRVINLPAGIAGGIISFADLGGIASGGNTATINPNGSEKIMSQGAGVSLTVDDFDYISFDLVYINATIGWTVCNLQR